MNGVNFSPEPFGVLIPGTNVDEVVEGLREAGRQGFRQVQMNLSWHPYREAEIDAIAGVLDELKIRCPLIGVYCNPLRPDEPVWFDTSMQEAEAIILWMDRLGANGLVIWTGSYTDDLLAADARNDEVAAFNAMLNNISPLFDPLRETNSRILLEPWITHAAGTVEKLEAACASAPEVLGCIFDLPNLIPQDAWNDQAEFLAGAVRRLEPYIGAVHLKDMDKDEDGNLLLPGPGGGCADYPAMAKQLSPLIGKVPFVIEHVGPEQFTSAARFVKKTFGLS